MCASQHVKQVRTMVLTLHYDYHYEDAFRGQRKNKTTFLGPRPLLCQTTLCLPAFKRSPHSQWVQQPVLCDPVAPATITAAEKWQSFTNYPSQKDTRQAAVFSGLFVVSCDSPACFACVRCTFEEQKDNTSSWAQLASQQPAASLSIPVAVMTGSTDGYQWHPQQCQRSFTVFGVFCWLGKRF